MNIDNITYEHRHANFIEAKSHALKLIGLLKGCISAKGEEVDIDIGAIASNIGSPEMQSVEQFILNYVTVKDVQGTAVLLDNPEVFNNHWNTHRSHYFKVIFDGLKFHFADFLPAGVASAKNTKLSAILSKLNP
jgi:hypothetical protein